MILLADLVSQYALTRDIKPDTVLYYRYVVRCLNLFAGGSVCVGELTDDLLNRWLSWMLEEKYSRKTIRNYRAAILTLWRNAYDDDLVDTLPRRVRLVRRTPTVPEAWRQAQTEAVLREAEQVGGRFRTSGIPRGKLLRALVLASYYSGLRPCDILALRWEDIGADGCIAIIQAKTSWPILAQLPIDCMAAILETVPPDRERVFPLNRRTWYKWAVALAQRAGLKGSPKWLRRSGATAVEKLQRGSAQGFLGHKTPGLAYRHYVDPRLLDSERPLPPRLDQQH